MHSSSRVTYTLTGKKVVAICLPRFLRPLCPVKPNEIIGITINTWCVYVCCRSLCVANENPPQAKRTRVVHAFLPCQCGVRVSLSVYRTTRGYHKIEKRMVWTWAVWWFHDYICATILPPWQWKNAGSTDQYISIQNLCLTQPCINHQR